MKDILTFEEKNDIVIYKTNKFKKTRVGEICQYSKNECFYYSRGEQVNYTIKELELIISKMKSFRYTKNE